MYKISAIYMCFLALQCHALEAKAQMEENSHEIAIEIKMNCPMSDELRDFVKSIPPAGTYSSSLDVWKSSFVNNMTQLIRLVESGKMSSSFWSVKTDDDLAKEMHK